MRIETVTSVFSARRVPRAQRRQGRRPRVRTAVALLAVLFAAATVFGVAPSASGAAGTDSVGSTATTAAKTGLAAKTALAPSACTTKFGDAWNIGPYWWGEYDADFKGAGRVVLDVQGPWAGNGVEIHLWHWYGGDSQYWCLQKTRTTGGHPVYRMRNFATGGCLDIQGPWTGNGVAVHQWGCDEHATIHSQEWIQLYRGELELSNGAFYSSYSFKNAYNGGCLDVRDYQVHDGATFQTWSCSGGRNQQFY